MRQYTQAEFDAFERDASGYKICPIGDYTVIKNFGRFCKFGGHSLFAMYSTFGDCCAFGEHCTFGPRSTFGEECEFRTGCRFGLSSTFGMSCKFGYACNFDTGCTFGLGGRFDTMCVFGKNCDFGQMCAFGESCFFGNCCQFKHSCFKRDCEFGLQCTFGDGCVFYEFSKFENLAEYTLQMVKIDRIGSRRGSTYFFRTKSNIFVRCGCFFGTLSEFEKQVKKTHKDALQYKREYLNAIKYIKSIMPMEDSTDGK